MTPFFTLFAELTRILWGTGIGRLPLTMRVHKFLYSLLTPKGIIPVKVLGSTMFIDTSDASISPSLLVKGIWESYTTELFIEAVKQGDTVVDIGAHWGYYTLLAARLVGPKGRVYAIEPETKNRSLLTRNIEENGYQNVVVLPYAVGNKRSEVPFYINRISGSSSLFPVRGTEGTTTVEAATLDELLKDTRIDVIKIDVEGAEGLVLQGMKEIIRSNGHLKVFMELWTLGPTPDITTEVLSNLQSEYGFGISIIDERRRCTKTFNPKEVFEVKKNNAINLLLEKIPL